MFFKKKICPGCEHRYDELADECPFCKLRNEDHLDLKRKCFFPFLPWRTQILLFGLGFVGFIFVNIIFSLIFYKQYEADNIYGSLLINVGSYLTLFIAFIGIMIPFYKPILTRFKKLEPYLWGIVGSIVLVAGSMFLSFLAGVIYPPAASTDGGNQTLISEATKAYPIICILVFGIVGPIVEEFTYRLGLYSFLRRVHPAVAFIVTSLFFALIHFDLTAKDLLIELAYLPGYVWGGFVFSFLYDRKGLGASLTTHILNNLFSLIMVVLVP